VRAPATAIIVTYQSERTIRATLLAVQRCRDAGLLEAIIVDNNSTDATRTILAVDATWALCRFNDSNRGFARACNIGFEGVTTPYTMLINPDAVIEPDSLRTLLNFMDAHREVGIAGPSIIEGESSGIGAFQDTGDLPTPATMLRQATPILRRRHATRPIIPGSAPQRTGWVCGAVLIIRTDLMADLNGFDPRFFLYWEEMDLCARADMRGYQTWAVGTALAQHLGGASSATDDKRVGGCIARHYFQSRYYFMVKHHGLIFATVAEIGEFVMICLQSMVDLVRGRGLGRLLVRMQAPLCSMPKRC
jgi:hypothetical protein